MSRKYKFHDKEGIYFVSFATVYWIDLFVREVYFSIVTEAMQYHVREKGMELFCWCIMPSHVHMIFRDQKNKHPELLLGGLKSYTSRMLQKEIALHPTESRREWMQWMMQRAGDKTSNVNGSMLWQHHNKPIELWSGEVMKQKLDYTHLNPVVAGFVTEPEHWKYSSAVDYAGGKGLVDVTLIC